MSRMECVRRARRLGLEHLIVVGQCLPRGEQGFGQPARWTMCREGPAPGTSLLNSVQHTSAATPVIPYFGFLPGGALHIPVMLAQTPS